MHTEQGKTNVKQAHLALWTQDLEAAASLWRDYFDADVAGRYNSNNRPGFASRFVNIPGNDTSIEVMEGPWVTPHPGEACGWAHIAFSVGGTDQVDATVDRFRHDGLLVSAPRRTGDGYYESILLKKSLLLCSKAFDSLIIVELGVFGDDGYTGSSNAVVL
ncbi:VOC family protein [Yoonia sp. R2-816]|uniref:VOC family protein n=1 Tax=Yoonia sp. R2-816 TaxID=3342638 RepID=UPI0037283CB7